MSDKITQGAMLRRLQAVLSAIEAHEDEYVDSKMLQDLKITVNAMNLDGGRVGDHETRYTVPFSPKEIETALQISNPWDLLSHMTSQKRKRSTPSTQPMCEAYHIWNIICCLLEESHDDCAGIMPIWSNWAQSESEVSNCFAYHDRFDDGQMSWCLGDTYRQYIDVDSDQRDADIPHTMAFLSSFQPHDHNKLLTTELRCALYLAGQTWIDGDYSEHRFFPSTIISGSGRNLRIVECIFDSKTGAIDVRKTSIMEFEHGILAEQHRSALFRLLG